MYCERNVSFTVPVGPFRGTLQESLYLRFSTLGNLVVHAEPRLFYKHRGAERRVEGPHHFRARMAT